AATAAEIAISTLEAEIGTLRLSGSGRVNGDGRLGRLELSQLIIGDGTELALIVAANAEDEWAVSVSGPKLDLRPAIAAVGGDSDAAKGAEEAAEQTRARPIRLEAAVQAVTLSDATTLREVAADAMLRVDGSAEAHVRAIAQGPEGDRAPLEGQYVDDGAERRVVVESLQAGALLRALGYFDDGSEGRARVDAQIEPGGAVTGALLMEDFVVKDAPELAQILSFATLFGIYDQLQSGGVSFSQVRAPFQMVDGVLTIEEAAATGPSIGLTLSGEYRRKDGALDFSGSLSPAFAVNGLISGVPLLGDLLTGGSGEGVIGVAYTVSGSVTKPEVSVNPLSVFAPGPFRQLFQGGESDQEGLLPSRQYER
nr:AsmA-like C-terminal region-containing protein [Paracoccaceae bacterium]